MVFLAIFAEDGWLYSACYPEHETHGQPVDVFQLLFNRWTDPEYLLQFFKANPSDLASPFWKGMTIDQAVKQVQMESQRFEELLWSIETKQPGYEELTFRDLFKPLHDNIYSLNWSSEQFRKARPDISDSMLRIYAIEQEDGSFVVTGGVIKLTQKMVGEQYDLEIKNLKRVRDYLKEQGIFGKEGLEAL